MRWALIGASRIAAGHMIGAIRSVPGHDVKAVLSSDAARGRAYADDHGIETASTDMEQILCDPDIGAVYISTTNEKHYPQAMAAIEAGKHVLCEKPLAMSLSEAVDMVRAAEKAGLVFGTNHHLRNAGSHLAVRDLVSEGHIGEVLSVRVFHAVYLPQVLQGWRINDASAGGGVILDIVVHDADTVRFHLGEEPKSVVAIASNSSMAQGVEDSVMSVWSMPSGASVQTHESFTHGYAGTALEIHGSKGSIFARNVMTQRPTGEVWLQDASGRHDIRFSDHNLYARSMGEFAKALSGQGRPAADGIDGVKSLAVALAVRDAARTGQRTDVDYGGV